MKWRFSDLTTREAEIALISMRLVFLHMARDADGDDFFDGAFDQPALIATDLRFLDYIENAFGRNEFCSTKRAELNEQLALLSTAS